MLIFVLFGFAFKQEMSSLGKLLCPFVFAKAELWGRGSTNHISAWLFVLRGRTKKLGK